MQIKCVVVCHVCISRLLHIQITQNALPKKENKKTIPVNYGSLIRLHREKKKICSGRNNPKFIKT